ncbi:hypothetical protein MAR_001241 [Mya arenaria]|uniref:Uncharacterized protein n=1 Tax=Mya arenaria TaxID=6604 RepID=A0ABY7FFA1_MYAAR|nr:hypothetical protein MAR_001241 [Mya arenaria]
MIPKLIPQKNLVEPLLHKSWNDSEGDDGAGTLKVKGSHLTVDRGLQKSSYINQLMEVCLLYEGDGKKVKHRRGVVEREHSNKVKYGLEKVHF